VSIPQYFFIGEEGGRGSVELQKMPLNTFWSKFLRDDDESIGIFFLYWLAPVNTTAKKPDLMFLFLLLNVAVFFSKKLKRNARRRHLINNENQQK
jgi:hypothetical protein